MAQATNRSYTTLSVPKDVADEVHAIKDEKNDPNAGRTVRRLVDYYKGPP